MRKLVAWISIALFLGSSLTAQASFIASDNGSSDTWPAGTSWTGIPCCGPFVSQSDDPMAPFTATSVHFRGYLLGGSQTTLPDLPDRYLVFSYELDSPQPAALDNILIEGAAFNRAVFRILDQNKQEVWRNVWPTEGNQFQSIELNKLGLVGSRFYFEEYDISTGWRYVSDIKINVPEPGTLALLGLGLAGLAAKRRRKQ